MKAYIIKGITALLLIVLATELLQDRIQAKDGEAPSLTVDGEPAASPGSPFFAGDILYIPVRVMGEYYPYTFSWNNKVKSLTLASPDGVVVLQNGSRAVNAQGAALLQLSAPVLLRQGHAYIPADSLNPLTGAEVTFNASGDVAITSGSVSVSVRQPVEPLATAENSSYKLFAALKEGRDYKGLIIETNGTRHPYDWIVPRLPSYKPMLYAADIDSDGQSEAVVVFTIGTGTGVHMEEIHVVKPQDGEEIPVLSPEEASDGLIESRIMREGTELVIDLKLKGKTPQEWSFRIPDADPDYRYNSSIGVGGVVYYKVDGDKLKAEAAGDIGFANYMGDFDFEYALTENGLVPVGVSFTPYPEFEKYS